MKKSAGTFCLTLPLILAVLGALAIVLVVNDKSVAQEIRNVRGTTVSLAPPEGFEPATDFAGFVNNGIKGTISVTELPKEAFGEMSALFSDVHKVNAKFSQGGIKVNTLEWLATNSGETIPLIHGTQDTLDGRFDKWMALYGGTKTALVTLQVWEQNRLEASIVREVFASAKTGPIASEDEQLSLLPFHLDVSKPFRLVGTPAGAGALLTVGPNDVNSGDVQPILAVVHQTGSISAGSLEKMAETQLRITSSFRAAEIRSTKRIEFAGSEGVLLEGTVMLSGSVKQFSQRFSISKDGFFLRMIVVGNEAQMQELHDAVERIASSVTFKS
ncbi:hypothetical protein [Mesorhizobium sp. B1-1-5]|uniref:hypothetical protein n=1 Tax=Mesorhizobium sp. B1-1-5 TaxID=2589979 RepID=UPI00112D84EA|nr:hypothetical protein [Mesorhizobium sp. B1-1-5]TPO07513.1 hypothetical protein FJ980_12180 [Mesorhizobium sp. B1-1-5]